MGVTLTGKSGGKDFKILDAGTHAAACDRVVHVGPQRSEWQGEEKIRDTLFVRFVVPAERIEWEDGDGNKNEGPMSVWGMYTASLGEKAKLRKHLEGWRGRAFTQEELAGFDLDNILGAPCMLTIIHNESGGKTYANIGGISKLMKGMDKPQPEDKLVMFDFHDHTDADVLALPEWLSDKVNAGKALQREMENAESAAPAQEPPPDPRPNDGFEDSDIPF